MVSFNSTGQRADHAVSTEHGTALIDKNRLRTSQIRVLESEPVHVDEDAVEYDRMVRRHAWLLNRLHKSGLCMARVDGFRGLDFVVTA